ncbi:hypothetical protein FISHEDRAFT_38999 [Fistulina hepatica ATCC 64428]|uniref:Rrp15p-domain-containing protein n=1 Tax=Fistulina hepatica ATCC 64428 TaxID=1128425 RepID=A0A0D7AGJ8_9AGAR|nr:hypothetical protein FISHEDRAFT_38999 [Fistulina hepatica ATCC 64428]
MPVHPHKRRRLSKNEVDVGGDDSETASEGDGGMDASDEMAPHSDKNSASASSSAAADESADDIDVVAHMKNKSKQTSKRKLRATGPSTFGATLQSLLTTDTPTTLPLSLKPSVARKANDQKLERRAKKILQEEKKEHEDKCRITDAIGGWGGESERALKKIAQRGVVKLFNTIQQTQAQAETKMERDKANKGSGKPTLPAPTVDVDSRKVKKKRKDNIIGRGKDVPVEKEDFFSMIRSGGTVSKA